MYEPTKQLLDLAKSHKLDVNSRDFASLMDERDELRSLRDKFYYPKLGEIHGADQSLVSASDDCIYMIGASLGLQPKGLKAHINRELDKWAKFGVHGHEHGDLPWAFCDEHVVPGSAKLVGALDHEVAVMNALTVNLHVLLTSFYRPTSKRYKVLLEAGAFPSDHYAIESQIRLHGFKVEDAMICMKPRENEYCLRTEDILSQIDAQNTEIALVLFSGVQYYTGQLFDIKTITAHAQKQGCVVGWDLAHAVGNVPLQLHDWNVDFAVWCSYKYLCTGAGGIGGAFVHQRHADNDYPRLLGWWSHDMKTRFKMDNKLELSPGAAGYRISNPSMLLVCAMQASLDVFGLTTMEQLRAKSLLLTGYLELLLHAHFGDSKRINCEILTPANPSERGCQLSVMFNVPIEQMYNLLVARGVACDKRNPNVLRLAPIHLYNSFTDVWRLVDTLKQAAAVL